VRDNRSKSPVRRLLHALYWIEHRTGQTDNQEWNAKLRLAAIVRKLKGGAQ